MVNTVLDLGRATCSHSELSYLLSSSASASIQSEHHTLKNDVSFDERFPSPNDVWVRCYTPLSFNLLFAFDESVSWTFDNSHLMQAITAAVAAQSLWDPFDLVVKNTHASEDLSCRTSYSFSVAISLEPSPLVIHQKSKRWRRYVERSANDLNLPPGLSSVRLSAIQIQFLVSQKWNRDCEASNMCGEKFHTYGYVELVESSMKSLLSSSSRMAKNVSRSQPFEETLEQIFPSIFCPSYSQAVAKRSLLTPSISRSLQAFHSRFSSTGATTMPVADPSMSTHNTCSAQRTERTSYNIDRKIEIPLWRLMMNKDILSRRLSKRSSANRGQQEPRTLCSDPLSAIQILILHDDRAQEIELMTDAEDIDMGVSLFEQSADQAKALDLDMRQEERSCDSARSGRMSFEELGEIQVPSSCSNDEWGLSPDTKGSSSQNTVVASDAPDFKESWNYQEHNQNTDFEVWDQLIGPCDELTQISGRGDPSKDPVLRSLLGPSCDEIYLEELHISKSCLEDVSNAAIHAVFDLDHVLCDQALCELDLIPRQASPSINIPTGGERDLLLESSLRESSPTVDERTDDSCGEVFGLESFRMQANEAEIGAWRSRLSSPNMLVDRAAQQASGTLREDTSRPEPGSNHQQSFSYSFMKRSSTVSTQSSSTSGSPRRHRRILQRLSRRSSTKSKHDESELNVLEFGVLGDRDIEVKRRKTLEDYKTNDDREDDEMLFV